MWLDKSRVVIGFLLNGGHRLTNRLRQEAVETNQVFVALVRRGP